MNKLTSLITMFELLEHLLEMLCIVHGDIAMAVVQWRYPSTKSYINRASSYNSETIFCFVILLPIDTMQVYFFILYL